VSASRDASELTVTLHVADGHFLYEDRVTIGIDDAVGAVLKQAPKAKEKADPFLGETVKVFAGDSVFTYSLPETAPSSFAITVDYQGCSETLCFPPKTETLRVGDDGVGEPEATPPEPAGTNATATVAWRALAGRFEVAARETGYLKKGDFLNFLEQAESGSDGVERDKLRSLLQRRGIWAVVAAILIGGLLLNLTPCVLPMIPINLAIIGAGAKAGSKLRGLLLGGAYGLGMAAVYGVLGLAVVLAGATFGSLNSSPWFNLAIALVFVVLTLAMLDVIPIDFSRFQRGTGTGGKEGSFITALVLGGVAALLAGACVAPVLISVLLLATDFYARGDAFGLVLPFLLGVGMALPWPIAGAGLSVLPKPGKWMSKVKYLFAALMVGFVVYYGHLAVSLFGSANVEDEKAGWYTSIEEGLAAADAEEKPVFIDMWASWCKNCLKMEKTTFHDKDVESRLEAYVKIRYRAEDLRNAETKAVMDHFGAIGLPTYVILSPVERQ